MSTDAIKLPFIKLVYWLCLLITSFTVQATTVITTFDSNTLSRVQISQLISPEITRRKTSEFANWLNFAPVPDAINLVHGLIADPDMDIVQKEAILLRLTKHLRSTTPTPADRAVMLELTAYESRVMTEHHDDPRLTEPAFNIAASAKGALNEWRYQAISAEMSGANIMQMWHAADNKQKRYILAGLRSGQIPQSTLAGVHAVTLQHKLEHPDLAMAAAIGSGDLQVATPMGSMVTPHMALDMLKTVASGHNPFNDETTSELLQSISQHADPAIAGLALNALARQQPDSAAIAGLVAQLGDQVSGVSAAMTLAQVLTDNQLQELQSSTDHHNKLLQARIKLIQQLRTELK